MHNESIHRKSYTFDTDILPWKPNLRKPAFIVSFYFNLKELFRNYNLTNLIDGYETHSPIRCPSSIPDCLPIFESPIMKWYTPAWDPLNPKTSYQNVPLTHSHSECASHTLMLSCFHTCMLTCLHTSIAPKPLLRTPFIILYNDKTLNLDLQRDRRSRLDLALTRSTITT